MQRDVPSDKMNNKPGLSTRHRNVCSLPQILPDFSPGGYAFPLLIFHWASAEHRYAKTARVCPPGLLLREREVTVTTKGREHPEDRIVPVPYAAQNLLPAA